MSTISKITAPYLHSIPAAIKVSLLTLAITLSGCGSDADNKDPDPDLNLPESEFTNIEGLPNALGWRLSYMNKLEEGINTQDGGFIVLGESFSELHKDGRGVLLQLDEQLNIERQVSTETGFAGVCLHDSGDYTLGKIIETDDSIFTSTQGVMLQRYSSDHQLLEEVQLKDPLMENYYDIVFERELWLDKPFTILSNEDFFSEVVFPGLDSHRLQPVSLYCSGEDLVVSFNHYGKKIAYYNDQLEQEWIDTLMIDNYVGSRTASASAPKVFFSNNGQIFAATELNNLDIPAVNHRFESNLPNFNDYISISDNILLKQWNDQGQVISMQMLGSEFLDEVAGIAMVDDTLWVTAKSHVKKFDQANYKFEWDISVFQLNPSALDETALNTPVAMIDVDKEDWLEGMSLFNNQLWLYGHNGYQQVDTNSYTSNPNGFYGLLNLNNLELTEVTTLTGPRATGIKGIINSEYSIISLGNTDAPITHTLDRSSQGLLNKQVLDLY